MLKEPWRITLCGGLTARQGTHVIARFRTQKTGLLLAYLALHSEQAHGREELAELFWYDSDKPLHSLRMALASLRQQLEPPGVVGGEVLAAGRTHIALAPGAVHTDMAEFCMAAAEAERVTEPERKTQLLKQALDAVSGELLPGSYMDWALQAREVFAEQVRSALKELVGLLTAQEELEEALLYALRLVHRSPLEEEAYLVVMRLLIALKRPGDVLQQFERLTMLLQEELGVSPSARVQELAAGVVSFSTQGVGATPIDSNVVRPSSRGEIADPTASSLTAPPDCPPAPALFPSSASRLPLPRTPFFGREREFARLLSLFAPPLPADSISDSFLPPLPAWRPRVVTLLGTGGSGKTRLAIEAAQVWAGEYGMAVGFISLVDADTSEHMMQLISEAVCPDAQPEREPLEVIVAALGKGAYLLVLDNMEQISEVGGEMVSRLLERLPDLSVLITSRHRLDLDGERELVLLPLPTPEREDTPECLLEFASVQLFVDRAQAARADFQLTARNAASVGALCRRLEGLPLALELAASWAQTLSPAQMLARLDRRFDLLRTRRKGIAPRHQALEACIAWSFRLLSAEVKSFFCRLCLLRGEWTLETAEIISGDSQALDTLQRLREASFLLVREAPHPEGTVMRFHMLESLREFGLERLGQSEMDAGYERLVHKFLEPQLPKLVATIDAENIRAAVQWCRTSTAGHSLELPLLNALMHFWCTRGGWTEGRRWLQEALLRHAQEPTPEQRKAWNALGFLHVMLNDDAQARGCFERALTDAEGAADSAMVVRALNNLAILAARRGDFAQACALGEQSLRFALGLGDEPLVVDLLNNVGVMHLDLGHVEKARAYLEQSLQKSREQNMAGSVALCLSNLAEIVRRTGDLLTARQMYEESLEIFRAVGEEPRVAETLVSLGALLEEQGDFVQARAFVDESALLRLRLEGG